MRKVLILVALTIILFGVFVLQAVAQNDSLNQQKNHIDTVYIVVKEDCECNNYSFHFRNNWFVDYNDWYYTRWYNPYFGYYNYTFFWQPNYYWWYQNTNHYYRPRHYENNEVYRKRVENTTVNTVVTRRHPTTEVTRRDNTQEVTRRRIDGQQYRPRREEFNRNKSRINYGSDTYQRPRRIENDTQTRERNIKQTETRQRNNNQSVRQTESRTQNSGSRERNSTNGNQSTRRR